MPLLLLVVAAACGETSPGGAAEPAVTRTADAPWAGTIETEGNVTRVRNESGSVWGGTARLVEEASIGGEGGEPPYVLGQVRGLVASDERIYVLDARVPIVRVYDFAGGHLMDIGGAGEGTGEFERPDHLSIAPDGAIGVRSGFQGRFILFDPEGGVRETWPLQERSITRRPTVITASGTVFMPDLTVPAPDDSARREVMIPWGAEGAAGEPIEKPEFDVGNNRLEARVGNARLVQTVPFAPESLWALSPTGAVIAGSSADYSFEIDRPDGTGLEVEMTWAPVAVAAAEARWHRERITAAMRRRIDDWEWNAAEVPPTKPAFRAILPTQDGGVWLFRDGPGVHQPECEADPPPTPAVPCWRSERLVDVFAADGRYLGPVELPAHATFPEGFQEFPQPFIRGDLVVVVVEDAAGAIRVKRYRLVLPGP